MADALRRWRSEQQRVREEAVAIVEREREQHIGEGAGIGLFGLGDEAERFAEVDELRVEQTNDVEDFENAVVGHLLQLRVEDAGQQQGSRLDRRNVEPVRV